MKKIIMMLIIFCFLTSFRQGGCQLNPTSQNILGIWEYQFSKLDALTVKLDMNKHLPVQRMVFETCIDSVELQNFPDVVVRSRVGNFFVNIKCTTFNDNQKIDEYFPIVDSSFQSKDSSIMVINYGQRYMSEYFIEKIKEDTIVVFDNKVYNMFNKEQYSVRHYYLRVHK